MIYEGVIIEESLSNKELLKDLRILSTKVEQVGERHQTPWLKQWTLHTVVVEEAHAPVLAEKLAESFDTSHLGSWYADFKSETHHYIIFPGKIFFIDRSSEQEYQEATNYGISLGIPDYQVDFSPHVKRWER